MYAKYVLNRDFLSDSKSHTTKASILKPQVRSKGNADFENLLCKYICKKRKIKKDKDMEVITIEKKTYEAMMARFRILTAKVDALCRECDEKRMGRWLDNQDVCQILNISLRTL